MAENQSTPMTRRGREKRRELWAGVKPSDCAPEETEHARKSGYEPSPDGYFVGRDPRAMTTVELVAMGHEQLSPMAAIRAKCLDCCAGSPHEVRLCVAMACPSWPFRMGKNPWRAPMSQERRAQLRERGFRSLDPQKTVEPIDEEPI